MVAKRNTRWATTAPGGSQNAPREKGWDEDSAGSVPESRCQICREQYSGKKEQLRPIYDELLELGKITGRGREGMSVPNDGAVLSESRFRTDQADDKFANRSGIRSGEAQRENYRSA